MAEIEVNVPDGLIRRYGATNLARAAGVSVSTVSGTWRRENRVPAERALRIHRALGVPLGEIRPDLWGDAAGEKLTTPA